MKDSLEPKTCADKLSALADPHRLRIVQLLREGPRNVGEVAAELAMSVVNASHHLNVLLAASLVSNEKRGRYVYYTLPAGAMQEGSGCDTEHFDLGCCRLEIPKPSTD